MAEVAPVLEAEGCSAGGDCHGGGIRGSYRLTPVEAKDLEQDFLQTQQQVFPFALDESPILTKPLAVAAGGQRHATEPFSSAEDPGYQTIRDWVHGGIYR